MKLHSHGTAQSKYAENTLQLLHCILEMNAVIALMDILASCGLTELARGQTGEVNECMSE